MATLSWKPRAISRAQVSTLTPGGTIEAGDIFNVTINGKTVSYSATSTTVASVCTGLAAALSASTITEFAEITWADATTAVTGTSKTTGVPFTLSVSTTESNGGAADNQTFSASTTTAATSPQHFDDANNWDSGAVPANSDVVYIDLSLGSILYGLDTLSSVTPTSITIYSLSRTSNTIGLPRSNVSGYSEYRTQELTIKPATLTIDSESPLIRVNCSNGQVACEVVTTGQSATVDVPAVTLRGTHASNTWEIVGGSVGLGMYDAEAANGASLKVSEAATVRVGRASSIDAITTLGTLDYAGDFDTLTCKGGTVTLRGSAASSSIAADGGTIDYRSTGTVTHAYAGGGDGGTITCANDLSSRTFTDFTLKRDGELEDPHNTVTLTNGVTRDTTTQRIRG